MGLITLAASHSTALAAPLASPRAVAQLCTSAVAAASAYDDGAFAVAPMMDYTNRFLRYLLRQLSSRSTLYTEMVTANTLVHCAPSELTRFLGDGADAGAEPEGNLVLQIGGAEPETLRRAAAIAAEHGGFTALNLNCGCPSDKVAGAGCFGAALMRSPRLVGECCAAMADGAPGLPVTVKCRIGVSDDAASAAQIDEEETYAELSAFVETVSRVGGVGSFAVHARKAVLGGLSPAQNRQVPPLRHNLVRRLAADFPTLRFSLNGGIESLTAAERALSAAELAAGPPLSGVMVGRAVIAKPWDWATVDSTLYAEPTDPAACRRHVLDAYCDFADAREAAAPQRIRSLLLAPAVNLFAAEPNGRKYRRAIDAHARDRSISAGDVIRRAADEALLAETLDAPPGAVWDHHEKAYREAGA